MGGVGYALHRLMIEAAVRRPAAGPRPGLTRRRVGPPSSLALPTMRLMIARCSIDYSGRLETHLAEATRLLMFKADGTFMVWSDHGSQNVKPLNWMTPPTAIEEV